MSKIEAGRLELSPSRVSLASVVEACLPLLRERSGEAGVALAVDLPPALPDLMAEEIRLKQIVLNLLSNAIKFTPSGGSVQLAAAIEPGGGLAIRVNDTGIGMSAEQIALARQPFHQVDNATTRRFEGTGLGLPLPERLVELHGGRLEIESAPGRGTRVAVRFPARLAIGADDEVESG
jgi:two-component system cell cycle sensor histidine kinase PleC